MLAVTMELLLENLVVVMTEYNLVALMALMKADVRENQWVGLLAGSCQ